MIIFEANCPMHGKIRIFPCMVGLYVCKTHTSLSYYTFPCNPCGTVRSPADLHITAILLGAGVVATYWSVPAEALEPHTGPALTLDDLIDLHFELAAMTKASA